MNVGYKMSSDFFFFLFQNHQKKSSWLMSRKIELQTHLKTTDRDGMLDWCSIPNTSAYAAFLRLYVLKITEPLKFLSVVNFSRASNCSFVSLSSGFAGARELHTQQIEQ